MKAVKQHLIDKRNKEIENLRQKVFKAGRKIFSTKRLEEVSMSEISKMSKVSRPLLYEYFKDREEIYLNIINIALSELKNTFEVTCQSSKDGLEEISCIGKAYFNFSKNNRDLYNAISHFSSYSPPISKKSKKHDNASEILSHVLICADEINMILKRSVERGIKDKSIRSDVGDPLCIGLSLWSSTSGLIQNSITRGRMFEENYGINSEDLFLQGLEILKNGLKNE